MKGKNILVVGGAGYIGSVVNKMLHEAGCQTIVLDNLSRGNRKAVTKGLFIQGDMANSADLDSLFKHHKIDAVMHFAALIDVGESVENPAKYYHNNVSNTLNLLEAMRRNNVGTFIFSSSAAIFGVPKEAALTESHSYHPINPYGQTKLIVEKILGDFSNAYGMKSCCLRYFNAAGADPDGEIKMYPRKETNLIPIVLRSLKDPNGKITIFGTDYPTKDGTCVRDYIHVADLGAAHLAAMNRLFQGTPSTCYNLGNGQGFTVREVIQAAEKVTGLRVNVVEGARRPGDPPILLADSHKAKQELGWTARYPSLEEMISHAWRALA